MPYSEQHYKRYIENTYRCVYRAAEEEAYKRSSKDKRHDILLVLVIFGFKAFKEAGRDFVYADALNIANIFEDTNSQIYRRSAVEEVNKLMNDLYNEKYAHMKAKTAEKYFERIIFPREHRSQGIREGIRNYRTFFIKQHLDMSISAVARTMKASRNTISKLFKKIKNEIKEQIKEQSREYIEKIKKTYDYKVPAPMLHAPHTYWRFRDADAEENIDILINDTLLNDTPNFKYVDKKYLKEKMFFIKRYLQVRREDREFYLKFLSTAFADAAVKYKFDIINEYLNIERYFSSLSRMIKHLKSKFTLNTIDEMSELTMYLKRTVYAPIPF